MFKGTKKMWKGIALLLALAMIPTGVFAADGDTATTVSIASATYAEATNTVTVTGTISDADADVTILALRAANALDADDLAGYTDAQLSSGVVYIDQEAFEGGNFTFEFIPRSGIKGGKMTIFVGGENVSTIALATIDAAVKAPDVVPVEPWYLGDDLKLNIYKAGSTDVYGDETAVKGWFDVIDSFKVNGTDASATRDGNVITVAGVTGPVTSIAITTTNGDYSEETWSGNAAQIAKPAGTISAVAASITAGNAATFTLTESSVEGWLAAAAAAVKVDGVAAAATLDGNTLSVTLPALGEEESKQYTVSIEVATYAAVSANVTAVAPTKIAADALTAPAVVYSESDFAETPADGTADADKGKLYGKASVALPATIGEDGVEIAWTIDGESKSGTVELPRALSDAADPKTAFVAVATISKDGYKTIEKTFTLNVNQCGIQGIDVTIKLSDAAAADLATVTVDDVAATANDTAFVASALSDGEHTAVVARPGFVTRTIKFVVAEGKVASVVTPEGKTAKATVGADELSIEVAMVAGDADDNGTINLNDFFAWADAFDTNKGEDENYSDAVDFEVNGTINLNDFFAWADNFDFAEWNY